jgi:hypothetical protein
MLSIIKKNGDYWLSIDGEKRALIRLGEHGPLVMAALEEASQTPTPDEEILRELYAKMDSSFQDEGCGEELYSLWLDAYDVAREKLARPAPAPADDGCAYDHAKLALDGHSTCPECGAIPPRR